MTTLRTKLKVWPALALAMTGTLALASCGETAEAPVEAEAAQTLAVTNARLSLPPVKGNPAALYFDVANSGDKDMMLRGATVAGAQSTQIHQMGTWNRQPSMDQLMQVAVPEGGALKFEPGALHVMVYDVADTVTAGSTAEVTLSFVGGDEVKFPAEVRAAGDDR